MKCSGCSACAAVCPKENCIKIEYNADGFLRPVKDDTICVHCGLCEKVCPMNAAHGCSLDECELYSAWADAEGRQQSSSGGIAAVLAEYAVAHGYEVCGAIMDYNTLSVRHKIFERGEDLKPLRGSKYLQSNVLPAFCEVLNRLKQFPQKKFVVFGTPCQISGFRNILEIYGWLDRVVLIDIFCHGVPSNFLWTKYMKWVTRKMKLNATGNIKSIIFRDKSYSWHEYFMNINGGGTAYVASREKDPFLKLFSMGVVNQESCFTCPFRNETSADIRLGDYWGERFKNNEDGVSMVLINGSRGLALLNAVSDKVTINRQDITDRFGQQHTDYDYPKYYEKSLELLKNSKSEFKDVIGLYESNFDRFKRRVKKIIKRMLCA